MRVHIGIAMATVMGACGVFGGDNLEESNEIEGMGFLPGVFLSGRGSDANVGETRETESHKKNSKLLKGDFLKHRDIPIVTSNQLNPCNESTKSPPCESDGSEDPGIIGTSLHHAVRIPVPNREIFSGTHRNVGSTNETHHEPCDTAERRGGLLHFDVGPKINAARAAISARGVATPKLTFGKGDGYRLRIPNRSEIKSNFHPKPDDHEPCHKDTPIPKDSTHDLQSTSGGYGFHGGPLKVLRGH